MGAGTSSGISAIAQKISGEKWQKMGTSKSFGIPGIGGAIVRRVPSGMGWGYRADVYSPNSNPSPINGGKPFKTESEAMTTAKKVLINRAEARAKMVSKPR